MGKFTIESPFSVAMLNYQRVIYPYFNEMVVLKAIDMFLFKSPVPEGEQ